MTKDELREHLKELDEATKGIREAMAPFVRAMDAVTGVREALLEEHETEVVDTCGGCGDVLLAGDRGFSYSDGPTFCEDCAPTWEDMRAEAQEVIDAEDTLEEDKDRARTWLEQQFSVYVESGGDPATRYTHPL